jgi:hypothetical protein
VKTEGFTPSRVIEPTEIQDAALMTGSKLEIPATSQLVMHVAAANAVIPTEDMTIITPHVGGSARGHTEGMNINEDGSMTYTSSEFIGSVVLPPAIGGVTSTVPSGGVLGIVPANPRFIDGCRLALFLAAYDQFCIESIEFEYIPAASYTQAGQILMAYINDITDNLLEESGLSLLRNVYSRPGRALGSVLRNLAIHLGQPLFKWYYTGSPAGGPFEMPGYIILLNQLAASNATTTPIPLGTIVCHYKVRVRSPTMKASGIATYGSASESLIMTNATMTSGNKTSVSDANSAMTAPCLYRNAIYWAQIVSADDTGPGNSAWRTWLNPADNTTKVMSAGDILIWRALVVGATVQVYFFPTLGAVLQSFQTGGTDGLAWYATATVAALVKGFKLWNINGSDASGYNIA